MYSWDGLSMRSFDRDPQVAHEDPYLSFLLERLHLAPTNFSSPAAGQRVSGDFLFGTSIDRSQHDSPTDSKPLSVQLQQAYLELGDSCCYS